MSTTKVAIVGLGTVGTGVARLLLEFGDRIARHAGRTLVLAASRRQGSPPRSARSKLPEGMLSDDLRRITGDPEITAVALLVGGLEPARTIMLELLESGKDVVTANKALLAEHGPELFDRARELGRSIAFEAAVAGGIPIIANISQCLSANQIQSLHGILNGTSNFILTQMEEHGASLRRRGRARRSGWAMPKPTRRWTSTAATPPRSWRSWPTWPSAPGSTGATFRAQGIDTLDVADLRYAKELGYRIKLLAVAQLAGGGLELHVSPTLVKLGTPLAEVRGAYNAISVVGDAVGRVFFSRTWAPGRCRPPRPSWPT